MSLRLVGRNNKPTYTGQCTKQARLLCDPDTALYPSTDRVSLAMRTDTYSNSTFMRHRRRKMSSKRRISLQNNTNKYRVFFIQGFLVFSFFSPSTYCPRHPHIPLSGVFRNSVTGGEKWGLEDGSTSVIQAHSPSRIRGQSPRS